MTDSGLFSGLLLAIVLGLLGAFLLQLTRNHRDTLPFQLRLFVIALAVRFVAAIVIYEYGLIDVLGDDDSSGWTAGLALAQEWERFQIGFMDLPGVLTEAFGGHHLGYYYALGLLFYVWVIGEPGRLVAAAFNCFAGALTVVFAYRAAATLVSPQSARALAWLTCLFPSLIAWSAQTLKEPIVIVLQAVALYCCLRIHREGFLPRYVITCIAVLVLMVPFRFYAVYVTGAALIIGLVASSFAAERRGTLSAGLGIAAAVGTVFVIVAVAQSQGAHFDAFTFEYINRVRDEAARGGSGVEMAYDLSTPGGLTMAMIVGIVHLLFAPFPWQWGSASPRLLLTIPEVVFWWWLLLAGVVPGVRYTLKSNRAELKTMLIFVVGFVLLYALLFGNVGQAYRQRAQLLPWLLIFALVGFEQKREQRHVAIIERQPAG